MTLAHIRPTGIRDKGLIVQTLYEIGYLLENDVNGDEASSSDFTITVHDRAHNKVGAGDDVKVLEYNGFNWAHTIQYLYECVSYMIASVTGVTEADFTGQVANLAGTLTGGTTTRNYLLRINGVDQGDFCQMLYEVVEVLIDDVTGPQASDFSYDVEDLVGNNAGVSG